MDAKENGSNECEDGNVMNKYDSDNDNNDDGGDSNERNNNTSGDKQHNSNFSHTPFLKTKASPVIYEAIPCVLEQKYIKSVYNINFYYGWEAERWQEGSVSSKGGGGGVMVVEMGGQWYWGLWKW